MVQEFNNKIALLTALTPLDPAGRAELLYFGNNRDLVLSTGANVTIYSGELKTGRSFSEKLSDIKLGLISRLRGGKDDGLGALGGKSDLEKITQQELDNLDRHEQEALLNRSDNIAYDKSGKIVVLTDNRQITLATMLRELEEELGGDLDLREEQMINIDVDRLKHLDLASRDDNYILVIWKGNMERPASAIDPHCYTYHTNVGEIDKVRDSQTKAGRNEVKEFNALPLFEALQRWGKPGTINASEDGRDLAHDYRYPHEYFTTWKIAADVIGNEHKAAKMVDLAAEIQSAIYAKGETYKIDFTSLAKIMNVDLKDMDSALELPEGTIGKMQQAIDITPTRPCQVRD